MLNDIDALVRASMAEWKVPGLALAIIQGDETLLQGWGVRDVDTPAPVDADTQFLLCSITKSFTAAGLGLLVDARKLDWSRPVREVLPEFRLHDTVATERATVRDLLSHTIGLPRHDWLHMPGDLSRMQMLAALRHLEPNQDLREGHQYQNLGYLVAGAIAERLDRPALGGLHHRTAAAAAGLYRLQLLDRGARSPRRIMRIHIRCIATNRCARSCGRSRCPRPAA